MGSVDFSRNPKTDELIGIVGEKKALTILKFIIASRTSKEDTIHQYDLPSLQDKDHRRQFHLFIKLNYPFVSTKTEAGIISLTIRPVLPLPLSHLRVANARTVPSRTHASARASPSPEHCTSL